MSPRGRPPGAERLSRSEWEIMLICWKLGRANVRQILAHDRNRPRRDYRTILTFLTRMAKKGYLEVDKQANVNYYTPALSREEGLRQEIDRFLTEVVGPDSQGLALLDEALERHSPARRAGRRQG